MQLLSCTSNLSTYNSTVIGQYGRILLWIMLLFLLALPSAIAQPEETMEKANGLYADKKYPEAIQVYEQLVNAGYTSEALHYNLGNAYYRNQELGKAILHYEKARLIDPADEDILFNLEVARATQMDQMDDLPAFFLTQWWKNIRSQLSTTAWTILALVVLWASAGGFLLRLLGKERQQRKRGFWWGLSLLIFSLLPFSLAISGNAYDEHSREAVLLTREADLHYAPDMDSEIVLTIHEGLKVDLQDRISDWYKVRLPNGEIGWLPVGVVEEI